MDQREAQKVPAFLHFHSYFFSLVLATSIITYSAYNYNGGWDCLVAASPLGCDDKDSGVDCIRGTNAKNIRFFIVATPLLLVDIVIISCMILLYHIVIIQERNLDRFNISGYQNCALSKRVAMQGIYFSGAYFLTWIFWYVYMVINTFFDTQID